MLRQNHFRGFSTFSVSRETAPVPGPPEDFEFSDEQRFLGWFRAEPLFLIPLDISSAREAAATFRERSPPFFQGNQFSSFLWLRRFVQKATKTGSPGVVHFVFDGTTFTHSSSAGPAAKKVKRSGSLIG
jgi:hypothetical protein